MFYARIDDLPSEVQSLSPDEATLWMNTYNRVFQMTQDDLASRMAAEGAVRKLYTKASLKALESGKEVIGWGLMFTDADNLDLQDTYFSKLTGMMLNYYDHAPLWMEHGWHPDYGYWPIGQRSQTSVYGHGVWLGHLLHANHDRYEQTCEGVEKGKYSYSSDSIGHYVGQGFNPIDSELRAWPFAGCSLTDSPAEPALGGVSFKSFVRLLEHQHDNRPSKLFPVFRLSEGAREALKARAKASKSNLVPERESTMDPQMLADLAAFFGVEPTVEAVTAAMQQAISTLSGDAQMSENEEEEELDPAEMRSALGMDAKSSDADLISALKGIVDALAAYEGEDDDADEPAPRNYGALGAALKFAHDNPASGGHYKTKPNPAKKNVHFNRGAKKPGVVELLRDINPAMPNSMKSAKAQSYQLGPTGGYILNHEVSAEILPALRDAIPLFDMGVRFEEMDGVESLTIPADKTENEAYWVGEDTEIPESTETVGGKLLQPKPLAARVIVPNKYLANSIVDYESRVREKIVYRIQKAIMRAALFGSGGVSGSNTGAQPVGLTTLAAVSGRAVTSTALGTNGAKPKLLDISAAFGRIEDANVELDESAAILFSPRTKRTFADMTDANGQPILRDGWRNGTDGPLMGFNWQTTNLIPNTSAVGSSGAVCSTIFCAVWRHLALGMSNQFEFLVDPYSRSSYLQTVIIASTYADLTTLYDEAFEILTGALA